MTYSNDTETTKEKYIEPETCNKREKYIYGPISWKLLNRINFLLACDTKKMDFVDITLHPKGYLCIRCAAAEVIFGFEFRIPFDCIQLPVQIKDDEDNSDFIGISAKGNEELIQTVQFVHEEKPDTDLGYTSGLSESIGFHMTAVDKAGEITELLNQLIDKIVNKPTLTFAEFPPYWED